MMADTEFAEPTPSSGPSDHLLPQGEKGASTRLAPTHPSTGSPSPLAGEGARRADEGAFGPTKANRLTSYARKMRRDPTEAERKLWLLLRNRRFAAFKFRRQVPIDHYIADFLCFDARLIIEADGSQHAETSTDPTRDAYLRAQGFRVLRLWNNDILARSEMVLEAVWSALLTQSDVISPFVSGVMHQEISP